MDESYYKYEDNNGNITQITTVLVDENDMANGNDEPDYVNRNPVNIPTSEGENKIKGRIKASWLDCFFTFIAIATYTADHATDILIARKFYIHSQWMWFGLVVLFLVLPSIVLQILSSIWHYDDNSGRQNFFSILLHILQLGPIERLCKTFYYGLSTICCSFENNEKRKVKRYEIYLANWRDISMLRFLESFLETAPQVVIQLFIILNFYSDQLTENWFNLVSVGFSIISLSWSIVTYTYVLKLCEAKDISNYGYIFQGLYRISIVASRIMTIIVFSLEYSWIILIILFIHWLLMICWLRNVSVHFCSDTDGNLRYYLEYLFNCVMGFVYIFCYINTKDGATRGRVTFIYSLFLIENSILAAAWLIAQDSFGVFESVMIFMIWGTFFIGIVSMVLYYQFFHPSRDVSGGWCHCCSNRIVFDEDNEVFQVASASLSRRNMIQEKVKVGVEFPGRHRLPTPKSTVESIEDVSIQPGCFPSVESSRLFSNLANRDFDDLHSQKISRNSEKFDYDFTGYKTHDFL